MFPLLVASLLHPNIYAKFFLVFCPFEGNLCHFGALSASGLPLIRPTRRGLSGRDRVQGGVQCNRRVFTGSSRARLPRWPCARVLPGRSPPRPSMLTARRASARWLL